VPAQLLEATRASREDAAAHVAELQQQLEQQAAAQQVKQMSLQILLKSSAHVTFMRDQQLEQQAALQQR
jgi:hypothetical protein